jgi:DNA replication protein DnaC
VRGRADKQALATRIRELLIRFKLKTTAAELAKRLVEAGCEEALPIVLDVLETEAAERQDRRRQRLRKASQLPPGKTFDSFDHDRLPRPLAHKLEELAKGQWVEEAANVLAFGLPGVGKSHAAIALGHALIDRGYSVLFTPTFRLVQDLLAAKRDLRLPQALRRLDLFDVLALDDVGYVQQSPEEVEVLFTLMAERYERRSLLITSNLVFSEWDKIFKNPMTTAAAIDRLVHHSTILEFNVPSYRTASARKERPTAPTEHPTGGEVRP